MAEYLTPHFAVAEMACRCGCGMVPTRGFMEKLEALRTRYGRPLVVSSGARCPAYNATVSGTGETGPHTTGQAVDLVIARGEAFNLLRLVYQQTHLGVGFTGIGFKQHGDKRFMHLDDLPNAPGQPRPTIWSYP